jgi:signal transduction histidine kinase/CheY-like chemotaxis protein
MVGLLLLGSLFYGQVSAELWWGWVSAMTIFWVLRLAHYQRFRRNPRADAAMLQRWHRSWVALVLLQGAGWAGAVILFYGSSSAFHRMVLILTSYSYAFGGVPLLAIQPRLFFAFVAVLVVPIIGRVVAQTDDPYAWQLGGVMVLLLGVTWLVAGSYHNAMGELISLKARTEELAEKLKGSVAIAESARAEAEAANRAKTQFLAAASHDLRQPLHALGLFAETLRNRVQEAHAQPLIHSIHESVQVLEGLFSQLMDISQLDSGGITATAAEIDVQSLFQRLRLHFDPLAFDKGLSLHWRCMDLHAHSDPLLVERILRNLISNALRYTEDGGVLVSCRPRGSQLLVQVWDSGVGIKSEHLPHIFEEFFQAPRRIALQAHESKGMGLGLAIVQRMSALIDSPIQVRSTPGRGSVFGFCLPRVNTPPPDWTQTPSHHRIHTALDLSNRCIILVEDDRAARDGLQVLLEMWGARVLPFGDVPSLNAWLQQTNPSPSIPHLLVIDHALPDGTTGLDALALVRGRWPKHHIPTIMITGSVLGGHEADAVALDFHLLTKPVLPNRLRAMIAFKLGS